MKDVDLSKFETDKVDRIREVMKDYEEIFSNLPGKSRVIEHDIVLNDDKAIRMKQYPVPLHFEKELKKGNRRVVKYGYNRTIRRTLWIAHGIDKKKRWYY